MMRPQYLGNWLECLRKLRASTGLIHIGPGSEHLGQYPYAGIPRLLIFEAQARHATRLQTQLKSHADCQVIVATLTGDSSVADFYHLSQANESGLFPDSALQMLWPNIKTFRVDKYPTTPLSAQMLHVWDAAAFNWVIIDCLLARNLMLGAGNLPRQWDVVMVRVLKNIPEGWQIPVLGLSEISELFANNGLTLVTTEEENNPLIVRALFVRMHPVHSKSEFERLMAENADLIRAKSELRTQLEVEERAKISALLQRDAMAEELIATTKLRDELYAIGERIKAQLVNQQLQIQQFDASNQESIERHRLAHAELFKAEVQIELLKDLLKSESGL